MHQDYPSTDLYVMWQAARRWSTAARARLPGGSMEQRGWRPRGPVAEDESRQRSTPFSPEGSNCSASRAARPAATLTLTHSLDTRLTGPSALRPNSRITSDTTRWRDGTTARRHDADPRAHTSRSARLRSELETTVRMVSPKRHSTAYHLNRAFDEDDPDGHQLHNGDFKLTIKTKVLTSVSRLCN